MTTNRLSTKKLSVKFEDLSFGGFLRSARTMKDLSQKDMAEFLGMAKGTLCDIEKGRQIVSIELASKIAKKCKLPEAMAVEYAVNDLLRRAKLTLRARVI